MAACTQAEARGRLAPGRAAARRSASAASGRAPAMLHSRGDEVQRAVRAGTARRLLRVCRAAGSTAAADAESRVADAAVELLRPAAAPWRAEIGNGLSAQTAGTRSAASTVAVEAHECSVDPERLPSVASRSGRSRSNHRTGARCNIGNTSILLCFQPVEAAIAQISATAEKISRLCDDFSLTFPQRGVPLKLSPPIHFRIEWARSQGNRHRSLASGPF